MNFNNVKNYYYKKIKKAQNSIEKQINNKKRLN